MEIVEVVSHSTPLFGFWRLDSARVWSVRIGLPGFLLLDCCSRAGLTVGEYGAAAEAGLADLIADVE